MPEIELCAAGPTSLTGSFDAILVPAWQLPEASQLLRMKAGGAAPS